MRHIGIYAGTFDPVHSGHIGFAQQAVADCKLDAVYFMPEPRPRGKHEVTPLKDRMGLLSFATGPYAEFAVLPCPQDQFSVTHTLAWLYTIFPESKLTLLMGTDVLENVHTWPNARSLFKRVSVAVGLRDARTREDVQQKLQQISKVIGVKIRAKIVHTEFAAANSSRVRAGEYALLTKEAEEYIFMHKLYERATDHA